MSHTPRYKEKRKCCTAEGKICPPQLCPHCQTVSLHTSADSCFSRKCPFSCCLVIRCWQSSTMESLKAANYCICLCPLTSKPPTGFPGGQMITSFDYFLSLFSLNLSLPPFSPPRVTWVKATGSCAVSTSNCSSPKWSFTSKWVSRAYKSQPQSPSSLVILVSPFRASACLRGNILPFTITSFYET